MGGHEEKQQCLRRGHTFTDYKSTGGHPLREIK